MVDRISPDIESWIRQLAVGQGREGSLTGHQRHFLRVLDGVGRPIQEEKQWLALYQQCVAEDAAPESIPEAPALSRQQAQPDPGTQAEAGYRERLNASAMYRGANERVTIVGGEFIRPTVRLQPSSSQLQSASIADTPKAQWCQIERVGRRHEALALSADIGSGRAEPIDRARITESRDVFAVFPRTEEAQWEYVFWTNWIWNRARTKAKDAEGGSKIGVVVTESLRGLSKGLKVVGDSAESLGHLVTEAVEVAGLGVAKAAHILGEGARAVSGELRDSASTHTGDKAADQLARGGKQLAAIVSDLTRVTATGLGSIGGVAAKHADIAGKAVEGLVRGSSRVARGAVDAGAYTDSDIEALRAQVTLARQACALQRSKLEDSAWYSKLGTSKAAWEYITIGGLTLADLVGGGEVPPDVQAAYQAAFPVESMHMDFAEKAASLGSEESLLGLVSAVKGKLFELKYLNELNADLASQGLHANLANSATQPGWDIRVADDDGHIINLMSLKATEHVGYVKEALERYPDIDVVSTTEAYAALAGTPEGAHVIDGGFDNVDLTEHVSSAANGHAHELNQTGLSVLALLPAAYRNFVGSDKVGADQTGGFVEDVSRAKTAALAGKTAMLVLPYWPAALLASVGVSMLANVGGNRREQYERLSQLLNAVRLESERLVRLRQALPKLGR